MKDIFGLASECSDNGTQQEFIRTQLEEHLYLLQRSKEVLIRSKKTLDLILELISPKCDYSTLAVIPQFLPSIPFLLAVSSCSTSLDILFGRPQLKLAP